MSTRGDKLGTTTQVKAKCGRKRRDEGRGEAAAHGEPLWLLASETEGVVRNFGKECARVRFREEILRNELPDPFLRREICPLDPASSLARTSTTTSTLQTCAVCLNSMGSSYRGWCGYLM